jgi:D-serine deaminase-like pyridoxal phosphate-dependent protein
MTETVRRAGVPVSVVLVILAMAFAENADAADVDVTAGVSVVRSAPSDVAPEVARVHVGDRLVGSDQLSGEWRFV